jgi:endonuclease III
MIMTILATQGSATSAQRGVRALLREFVDWNEVRVSSWKEIGKVLEKARLREPGKKGMAIKSSLDAVFSETNKMDLSVLEKKPPEKAFNFLSKLKGLDETAMAGILYNSLGVKSLQPSTVITRVAARIGFIQESSTMARMKQALKDFVKRRHAFLFHAYLARIGERFCFEKVTFCVKCPAMPLCKHGSAIISNLNQVLDEKIPQKTGRKKAGKKKAAGRGRPKKKKKAAKKRVRKHR